MKADRNPDQLHFQGLGERKVVASFVAGTITSEAGALLLRLGGFPGLLHIDVTQPVTKQVLGDSLEG